MHPQPHRNRLANEKSPYLRQHAANPVDWYPFGEEAIGRARLEDKPIFLSIGYSTCHWCHVMERESFENPAIAGIMNENYVNVKVDREERPDLDQVYMHAVMAMQGQGGWPLSVWLTPNLEPFYGGTYFPPDARWGRPGFADILKTLADVYRRRRAEVDENGRRMVEMLARGPAGVAVGDAALDDAVEKADRALVAEFDERFGGFGGAPKFPRTSILDLLVRREAREPDTRRRHAIGHTLEMMWRGGIYDHVGGGFARYSTDERWLVPHFEKMLYDNALLLEAYVDGALLLGRDDLLRIAADVAAFIEREMTHDAGGFYSAQDADSEGEEGRFYVFTKEELESMLGADAPRVLRVFGVEPTGNFEGANVLHLTASVSEIAAAEGLTEDAFLDWYAAVRRKLYDARERRPRPGLDDKVLTSWNGLAIHALARLGAVTGSDRWVGLARRAAEFVESRLVEPGTGTLLRRYRDADARFPGSLDDHAYLAFGYLGLFEATGEARWVSRARELATRCDELFAAPGGGYFFSQPSSELIARMKDSHDGALPSANSVLALLWARLGALFDDEALREKGRQTVRAFGGEVARVPQGFPLMLSAWVELREPPRKLTVWGDGSDARFRQLLQAAHRAQSPGRSVCPVTHAGRPALAAIGVGIAGASGSPTGALLCEDAACRPFPESVSRE